MQCYASQVIYKCAAVEISSRIIPVKLFNNFKVENRLAVSSLDDAVSSRDEKESSAVHTRSLFIFRGLSCRVSPVLYRYLTLHAINTRLVNGPE